MLGWIRNACNRFTPLYGKSCDAFQGMLWKKHCELWFLYLNLYCHIALDTNHTTGNHRHCPKIRVKT